MPLLVLGGPTLRREYVQRRATSRRCQRSSVKGDTKNDDHAGLGQRAAQRGQQHPVGRPQPRPRDLTPHHMQLVRSTRISSSFDRPERRRNTTSPSRLRSTQYASEPSSRLAPSGRWADPTDSARATQAQARALAAEQPGNRPPQSLFEANRVFRHAHANGSVGCPRPA
jgi:hypothetical protein